MRKNRLLLFALPVMVILLGLTIYEYGYKSIIEEIALLKETEEIKEKTYTRYLNIIAERPELEEKLDALKEKRKNMSSHLIETNTITLANAAIQETVKGIIISNRGTISSERIAKTEDAGKFKIINLTIDATVPDTKSLSDIIYSIETRNPYMVIKEVDARIRNFREPRDFLVKIDVAALTTAK